MELIYFHNNMELYSYIYIKYILLYMKWIFHFDSLKVKTKISKEQVKKYIDDGIHLLYLIDAGFFIYGYIYSLCAIDLFLNYISYNLCFLDNLEAYYLNCLKIIISLYEDDYADLFTFNQILQYL